MGTETRSLFKGFEPDTSGGKRLTGYAAVWDSPALVTDMVGGRMKTFTETVRRGAFRTAIESKGDVVSYFNHDPSRLLGRTSSGTLQLQEDNHGLRFDLTLPDSAADIRELVQRGDLRGASFRFSVRKGGEKWDGNSRDLTDLYLMELGPVVEPAYAATSLNLRSKFNVMQMRLDLASKF